MRNDDPPDTMVDGGGRLNVMYRRHNALNVGSRVHLRAKTSICVTRRRTDGRMRGESILLRKYSNSAATTARGTCSPVKSLPPPPPDTRSFIRQLVKSLIKLGLYFRTPGHTRLCADVRRLRVPVSYWEYINTHKKVAS